MTNLYAKDSHSYKSHINKIYTFIVQEVVKLKYLGMSQGVHMFLWKVLEPVDDTQAQPQCVAHIVNFFISVQ